MSEHTPGPWRDWEESIGAVMAPRSNDASWGSRAVALIAQWPSAEERAANARLIAAAPEMLEALEDARDWCLDDDGGDYWPYKAIIEAIDKATGSET